MRILVLSNTPFLPADAGNRARIDRMLAHLAGAGHEIAMLMLPAPDRPEWDEDGMRARLAWLEVASDPDAPRPLARARRLVTRALRGATAALGVDDWCPPWFRARARDCVASWAPDVVLVEYVFLSACLDGLPPARRPVTVIDAHDVMHRRRAVYDTVGLAPQWFHTTADEERRGLARADVVLAIQDEEAGAFRALVPDRLVLTVPHAEPVRPAPPDAAEPRRLLFVASYNDVNVRGLAWLLDDVWPRLDAAELVVCGTIAAKLGALPAGVVARGFVPSLDDEYAAARVVVCPALGGTGLAVKAVSALCHGRPIVATPAAAAGLAHGDAEGVLVGADAHAFAAAVTALLDDPARWRRAVAGAVAQATRRFAPDAAFAPPRGARTAPLRR